MLLASVHVTTHIGTRQQLNTATSLKLVSSSVSTGAISRFSRVRLGITAPMEECYRALPGHLERIRLMTLYRLVLDARWVGIVTEIRAPTQMIVRNVRRENMLMPSVVVLWTHASAVRPERLPKKKAWGSARTLLSRATISTYLWMECLASFIQTESIFTGRKFLSLVAGSKIYSGIYVVIRFVRTL
jgi:hypothetical protein